MVRNNNTERYSKISIRDIKRDHNALELIDTPDEPGRGTEDEEGTPEKAPGDEEGTPERAPENEKDEIESLEEENEYEFQPPEILPGSETATRYGRKIKRPDWFQSRT